MPLKPIRENKKLHKAIAKHLIELIQTKYGLIIAPESAQMFIEKLLFRINYHPANQLSKTSFLYAALSKYIQSSTIKTEDMRRHSCYFFANWLDRNFWIIPIPRISKLGMIIYKIKKLFRLLLHYWRCLRHRRKENDLKEKMI